MRWTGTWSFFSRGVALAAWAMWLSGCAFYTVTVRVAPRLEPFKKGALRVAVMPFAFNQMDKEVFGDTTVVRPGNAGDIVADATGDMVAQLGYEVVDRRQFQALLRSNGWTAADVSRPTRRAEIGRALNIYAVISGKVKELCAWDYANYRRGYRLIFQAGLVRLDTGQVVWAIQCEDESMRLRGELLPAIFDYARWRLRRAGAGAVEEPRWWNLYGILKRKIHPTPLLPTPESPPAPKTPPAAPPATKTPPASPPSPKPPAESPPAPKTPPKK